MSTKDQPYLVEAFTMSDSFDGIVDRHFRAKPVHRCEISGSFDTNRMVEELKSKLLRTRRESRTSASGVTTKLEWASLLFRLDTNVFATVFLQSGYAQSRNPEPQHKVTVIADSPEVAESEAQRLSKAFRKASDAVSGPAFLIMTGSDSHTVERAPLKEGYRLDEERLSLHYGEDFPAWSNDFISALSEPGISIIRGDPGTGKTYYLRHVMVSLCETHRFFYVPVDSFGILSSARIAQFWKREQAEFPGVSKVLILEDAENLLYERSRDASSPVSTILNLTDGLLSDALKLHLICTLNCKVEALDSAVVRPGRLKFYRDFDHIPAERARRLAAFYGKSGSLEDSPTLAEVFSSPDFDKHTKKGGAKKGVGFKG